MVGFVVDGYFVVGFYGFNELCFGCCIFYLGVVVGGEQCEVFVIDINIDG